MITVKLSVPSLPGYKTIELTREQSDAMKAMGLHQKCGLCCFFHPEDEPWCAQRRVLAGVGVSFGGGCVLSLSSMIMKIHFYYVEEEL